MQLPKAVDVLNSHNNLSLLLLHFFAIRTGTKTLFYVMYRIYIFQVAQLNAEIEVDQQK